MRLLCSWTDSSGLDHASHRSATKLQLRTLRAATSPNTGTIMQPYDSSTAITITRAPLPASRPRGILTVPHTGCHRSMVHSTEPHCRLLRLSASLTDSICNNLSHHLLSRLAVALCRPAQCYHGRAAETATINTTGGIARLHLFRQIHLVFPKRNHGLYEDLADEKSIESQTPDDWRPSRQVQLIVLGQMFVVFAISLDMTILTATLPTVAEALGATAVSAFWIAAAYLLANAVVQPLMAALADTFGRRSVIFTSVLLFTIGSIICAVSTNVATMLVGRAIQGTGGGGVLSVNLIIISDLVPLKFRPRYISFQQLCVSVGFNIAPIIGGVIIKHTTWRWLFYINLPFCAIAMVLIPFLLKYDRPKSTINDKLSNVDWTGSLMFVVGMTTFLIGITWGGTQFAWDSAATLAPIILGLATVFATGLYEHYIATVHFLRPSLFSSWSAIAVYACTILQALTLFTEVYFLVLYFIAVKMYTPLQAGIYILAFSLICVPASGIVGPVIQRLGRYRWAIWGGWLINTLALGVLTLLDVHTPTVAWVFMCVTAGIGQGFLFIAHSVASQAACQQKDAAHAMSMYSFMRSLGLCLGVAIGGTIFQNFLVQRLADLDLPELAKNAEAFAAVLREMTTSPLKDGIIGAYAWSFQRLFTTLCGISALGLLVSCAIGGHSLDQEHESDHRLKTEESSD